jgi:FkbM family methyltransferase
MKVKSMLEGDYMQRFAPTVLERLTSLLPERLARSIRWRYLRWVKPATSLDAEALGFRWRMHPFDNRTEELIWFHRKHSEEQSLSWLLAAVRGRQALIVDIGANCGAFSVPLAAAAGSGSSCIAFEPNPVMSDRLRVNLHLNGLAERVNIHPVALGATEGEAMLSFQHNKKGQATLRAAAPPGAHHVRVPVRPLSDYMSDADGYEVVALKIDVEGYEPEVLLPFFAATRPGLWPTHILVETEHSADWSSDLLAALAGLDYAIVGQGDGNTFLERRRDLA